MNYVVNKKELLLELENEFNSWKKKTGFDASLEQLDEIFFIKDYILASRFVSPKISRMICGRIRDSFNGWIQQIHTWLIPAPYSIISTSESQLFNDKEKEELNVLLREFMAFVSQNIIIGLTKDKKKEAEFVDASILIWKKHLSSLIKYSEKIQLYWKSGIKKE